MEGLIKSISKLTFREMMLHIELYVGLPDGLIQLPLPGFMRIRGEDMFIPKTLDEFTGKLCYGQRLFLLRKEENDFGLIMRMINGFYYPLFTGKKWDEDKALLFGKYILTCKVKDLYPVAMHLTMLTSEMVDREQKLLHREPSKMELAAGIKKLNVFYDLTSLDFLRDAMKITVPEVLLTPYNECLVRFMVAKETADFQERYYGLMKEETKPKSKFR